MQRLHFGTSSYSHLWNGDLAASLEAIQRAGFERVELMAAYPHPYRTQGWEADLDAARVAADRLGVQIVGVNPPGLDLNLVSPDAEVRELSVRRYVELVSTATTLGSSYLVVVPGRRHPLLPAPLELSTGWLRDAVEAILDAASPAGVTVVLENTPSNFLDLADELSQFIDGIGAPDGLSICYDVANGYMREDPAAALGRLGERAAVIHLSDTTADRWQHAPIGRGSVDFAALAEVMDTRQDTPFVMLETIHESDADRGLVDDRRRLAGLGWELGAADRPGGAR